VPVCAASSRCCGPRLPWPADPASPTRPATTSVASRTTPPEPGSGPRTICGSRSLPRPSGCPSGRTPNSRRRRDRRRRPTRPDDLRRPPTTRDDQRRRPTTRDHRRGRPTRRGERRRRDPRRGRPAHRPLPSWARPPDGGDRPTRPRSRCRRFPAAAARRPGPPRRRRPGRSTTSRRACGAWATTDCSRSSPPGHKSCASSEAGRLEGGLRGRFESRAAASAETAWSRHGRAAATAGTARTGHGRPAATHGRSTSLAAGGPIGGPTWGPAGGRRSAASSCWWPPPSLRDRRSRSPGRPSCRAGSSPPRRPGRRARPPPTRGV
jgi:hypothetical protein